MTPIHDFQAAEKLRPMLQVQKWNGTQFIDWLATFAVAGWFVLQFFHVRQKDFLKEIIHSLTGELIFF